MRKQEEKNNEKEKLSTIHATRKWIRQITIDNISIYNKVLHYDTSHFLVYSTKLNYSWQDFLFYFFGHLVKGLS